MLPATTSVPLIIGIGGASRSGKSTLAERLRHEFNRRMIPCVRLGGEKGLDTYFNKAWVTDPAHGAGNWESPGALNHQQILNSCLEEEAKLASEARAVLLLEGFRAFWDPRLVSRMHVKFEIGIDKDTALQRRIATPGAKGGQKVRPYFESKIWPEHCQYLETAVHHMPLVCTLDQRALPSTDAAFRAVLASRQLELPLRASCGWPAGGGAAPACCSIPGCGKPTWNGTTSAFCSHDCRSGSRALRTSPSTPGLDRLDPGDPTFENIANQFRHSWDSARCPVPPIKVMYETLPNKAILDRYTAKAAEIEQTHPGKFRADSGDGNENRRWHGTRLICNFQGSLCNCSPCAICGIISAGEFKLSKLGAATHNLGVYGPGIYFTSKASTAKGYGLAPGNSPPPANVTDFFLYPNVQAMPCCFAKCWWAGQRKSQDPVRIFRIPCITAGLYTNQLGLMSWSFSTRSRRFRNT